MSEKDRVKRPLYRSALMAVALSLGVAVAVAAPPAQPVEAVSANCSNTSVGYVPLTDADGVGIYDNANVMPQSHVDAAPDIAPIKGVVGVASLGMSNGVQEWGAFMDEVKEVAGVSSSLVFANGAVSSKTMSAWADPADSVWSISVDRIASDGLSASDVQVVWMKMGSQLAQLGGSQSERIEKERGWLKDTIANAKTVFPNLKRVYMSSRIYAGYNVNPNHSEPETGYDNGLAVKEVVADSIAGDTAVWTAWGPYLWADGTMPRDDGLTWECSDFEADGVHPSADGEEKVADLLIAFFSGEETACSWFLADPNTCGASSFPACLDVGQPPADVDLQIVGGPAAVSTGLEAYFSTCVSGAIERSWGEDRYETAAEIASDFFPGGANAVFVVVGDNFPDAMSASPSAVGVDAAVLLTKTNSVPAATAAALAELDPSQIYVVGGTAVISESVVAALSGYAPVKRLAGSDRYATAAAVSAEFTNGASTVFIATGLSYFDALVSGSAAVEAGAPLLLTHGDYLPKATASELARVSPTRIVIVGGTAAVSGEVEDAIDALVPGASTERLSGSNRYLTSVAAAEAADLDGQRRIFIATDLAFPDGLAAVAAAKGSPLLLVSYNDIHPTVATAVTNLYD